jgi:hypothetical protein
VIHMNHHYTAYGFILKSDTYLPELQPLNLAPEQIDLSLYFRTPAPSDDSFTWHRHPRFISRRPQDQSGDTWLQIMERSDGEFVRLMYGDGVEFTIDRAAQNLWVRSPDDLEVSYIASYLVNQGLGFIMRLRELTCLHASAIIIDGGAVLISAPSGYGKSTLATYFALRGYPVVADDICALRAVGEQVYVQPGYPRLRLTPETADALLGEGNHLSLMAPGWDKLYLPLNEGSYTFAQNPVPVRAVYVIQNWEDKVAIRPMPGPQAVPVLMANTYLHYLIDAPIQMADFFLLGRLVMSSQIRILDSCSDLSQISQVYQAILDDLSTHARG